MCVFQGDNVIFGGVYVCFRVIASYFVQFTVFLMVFGAAIAARCAPDFSWAAWVLMS